MNQRGDPGFGGPGEGKDDAPTGTDPTVAGPAPAFHPLAPGTLLGGTYRIVRKLGEGGMGTVFEAEHVRLERPTAVKLLRPEYLRNRETVGRFCREARAAGKLEHEGIVRIFDVNSEADGTWYIAMELLRGEDLASVLGREAPLPTERAIGIARQVCEALAAAHEKGIVHRDIKPANVFLVDRGDGRDHVKLLDFGVSKLTECSTAQTGSGCILGTPLYMSPEQACADPSLDHRADIFAVGVTLYEMLTGHTPFEAPSAAAVLVRLMTEEPEPMRRWIAAVPEGVDAVVRSCLARDPDARFATIRDVAAALARGAAGGREEPREEGERGPSPQPDELRVVTIVFATFSSPDGDIRSPEDTGTEIEPLVSTGASIMERHGGIVQRRFADGLMAVFGAPMAHGDDAVRATRAALEIRQSCAAGSQVRAGLSTGRVVAGRLRGAGESGFGVVGQAVALARRIEGLGREGSIVVCKETFLQIRGRFRVRASEGPPGASTYEIVEEHPHGLVVQPREVLGTRPPMVGRDVEMSQVVAMFHRAVEERTPQAVTVFGPPGLGKSRLAHEFRSHVESLDLDVLTLASSADDMAASTPLALWAGVVRTKTGVLIDEDRSRSLEKIAAFVRFMLGPNEIGAEGDVDAFAALLGLQSGTSEAPALRLRVQESLREILRGGAARFPIVVVLDDLQWADPASLALTESIFDRLDGCPVFLLGLARPEFAETAPRFLADREYHARIRLRPLSRRAGASLVREIVGDADENMVGRIASRAEGTPLFIEEILHVLAERGVVRREGISWRVARQVDSLDLPLTVEAILQARLDRLPTEERDLLKKAAVVGETFWDGTLRALGVGEPDRLVQGLVAREFVRLQPASRFDGQREYLFRHALVREAAYAILPVRERRSLHEAVASWVESLGTDALADRVLAAQHLEAAESLAGAAKAYIEAGRRAAANTHDALIEAREYFSRAGRIADQLGDARLRLHAIAGIGRTLARNAEHREAAPYLRAALDLAATLGERETECTLHMDVAEQCAAQGDRDSALGSLARAQEIITPTGKPVDIAEFHKMTGVVYAHLGEHEAAVEATRRAMAIAEEHGFHYLRAVCACNVADIELRRGNVEEARSLSAYSHDLAGEHGFGSLQSLNAAYLGYIAAVHDHDASGIQRIEQAIGYAEGKKDYWDMIQVRYVLALALHRLGRDEEAIPPLEEAMELAQTLGTRFYWQECEELLARIQARSGGSASSG